MMNFIKNHRALSVIIFLNIIAIVVVIILGINKASQTATIDIQVAPNGSTITLNGKNYENNQSYDLKPGKYEVAISMEGMITKTETLEISDGAFVRLHAYLLDKNGGFTYYEDDLDEFYVLQQLEDELDESAKKFIEQYDKKITAEASLPITYNEPANNGFGFISLYINKQDEITDDCLEISQCISISDATGGNYNLAISLLEQNGFIVDDYKIIYNVTSKIATEE